MSQANTAAEKQAAIDAVPFWWHSIDVGDGVVTPGRRDLDGMKAKWNACHVPDLKEKSVLDIGAWDGYFSFEAERRGARKVTAMDKFIWQRRIWQAAELNTRMLSNGTTDDRRIPRYVEQGYPNKLGFDTVHRLIESNVEQYIDDLATVDPIDLGMHDVVFYLGGLYHKSDPLGILKRLSAVTRELAIVETAGIETPTIDSAMFEFYPARELQGDQTNWWAPNEKALIGMLKAAGFRDAKIVARSGVVEQEGFKRNRLFAHAWK
nr:DUF1698 domain-containing protein [Hyphomonas sp. Mor2]